MKLIPQVSDSAKRRRPGLGEALARGFQGRCPACGSPGIFRSYIKLLPACPTCGMDIAAHPTDDIPAYFTILIVGHIVVPLLLITEQFEHPALWLQLAIWPAVTLI